MKYHPEDEQAAGSLSSEGGARDIMMIMIMMMMEMAVTLYESEL